MRCFSLFSGIGGFDLALKNCGHKIIGACEIDRYARAVYARHFPGVRIHENATKIRPEELEDFDLLCAGFPCQAFSIAGKRLGFEESRGTLFFEIARIAGQKRPGLLLLENVKGLLSHDRGKTFATILATLDELGYDAQWQVLNSKYFVPQNRKRVFIVGHLRGEPWKQVFPLGDFPRLPTHKSKTQANTTATVTTKSDRGDSTYIVVPTMLRNLNMNGRRMKKNNEDSFTLDTTNSSGVSVQGKIRRFTPVEYERLQGFPDGWTEELSDTQRYKCLGNAVTVPVAEFVVKRLEGFC